MTVTLESALNDAQLVKTYDAGQICVVMVWKGGVQYNIYHVYEGDWRESIANSPSSISDAYGEPLSRDEIEQSMNELAEQEGF